MSFDTILIANRGEIAARIIRTARAMGYRTVAVFTEPDNGAPHALAADLALSIGPAPAYLDGEAIIAAARRAGAQAVHPGYGFLSESAAFARACAEAGLIFIGPPPAAMEMMGSKAAAKAAMQAAGVPCLPGYQGADQSDDVLMAEGARLGFPLMVKASAGGGGKGMRLVHGEGDLAEALARARSEAEKSFGEGALILERALIRPRHVEIQVFADSLGNVIHLGERDCSVQRRHQKVVEESPSPAVDAELRTRMGAAAVDAARACGYVGAGTVEFLLDEGGEFHFLEMNTRLQVEHPVTEAVTGLDLVDWQIRVARGEALPLSQEQVALNGHAIEVRLYAEDPAQGFLPQSGRVLRWRPAPGLRVDHALEEGQVVGADYDPMLAKIIAHGPDRETARRRLIAGLEATEILGLTTNRAFLAALLRHDDFATGGATTAFLQEAFAGDASLAVAAPDALKLGLAAFLFAARGTDPFAPRFGWSNGPRRMHRFKLGLGEAVHEVALRFAPGPVVDIEGGPEVAITALQDGLCRYQAGDVAAMLPFAFEGDLLHFDGLTLRDVTLAAPQTAQTGGDGRLLAPMAGAVVSVDAKLGAPVERGQVIAVLEAMKMEHPLKAPMAGRLQAVAVQPGQQVKARQLIAEIEGEGE
ncbi:MAG: ATP-grasp domain-containing protein [Pararhodobacter sp.]|nr:ATP-grasp domain-containing protein [Pararhodobacter sp.]